MNEQTLRAWMSGGRRGLAAGAARAALAAASVPYAAAVRLRRWGHRVRLIPSDSLARYRRPGSGHPVRVVSVGNLTVGGTGKTPMAAWVVHRLRMMHLRPAILSRGYKSSGGLSDEAELLRALCPETPVVVDPDRLAGAQEAMRQGAEVMVLDDGFQHLRLRRDLDIVLIDATNPFGYGWCLPRGLLREPPSALRDAHAVVVTRSDQAGPKDLAALKERLARLAGKAVLACAVHQPAALLDEAGRRLAPSELAGRRVAAFCGIANPQGFFEALRRLGAELAAEIALEDHVRYTPQRVAEVSARAAAGGAELLVTTQKDGVKLRGARFDRPLRQLAVEMVLTEGQAGLVERLHFACAK